MEKLYFPLSIEWHFILVTYSLSTGMEMLMWAIMPLTDHMVAIDDRSQKSPPGYKLSLIVSAELCRKLREILMRAHLKSKESKTGSLHGKLHQIHGQSWGEVDDSDPNSRTAIFHPIFHSQSRRTRELWTQQLPHPMVKCTQEFCGLGMGMKSWWCCPYNLANLSQFPPLFCAIFSPEKTIQKTLQLNSCI